MKNFVALACLLSLAAVGHGSAIGWSGVGPWGPWGSWGSWGVPVVSAPILAPAAVSSQNQWQAPVSVPIIKSVAAPIVKTIIPSPLITSPLIGSPLLKTVGPISPLGVKSVAWGSPYGLGAGWGIH